MAIDAPGPAIVNTQTRFEDFASFYPYYLSEHSDRRCRLMHFIGTVLVIGTAGIGIRF